MRCLRAISGTRTSRSPAIGGPSTGAAPGPHVSGSSLPSLICKSNLISLSGSNHRTYNFFNYCTPQSDFKLDALPCSPPPAEEPKLGEDADLLSLNLPPASHGAVDEKKTCTRSANFYDILLEMWRLHKRLSLTALLEADILKYCFNQL